MRSSSKRRKPSVQVPRPNDSMHKAKVEVERFICIPVEAFAICGALGLLAVVSSLAGARAALYREYLRPRRFSHSGADQWVLTLTGEKPGYFVDIGAFPAHGSSNTRALEEHGWRGICADPMSRGFEERDCGYIPRPIAGGTGQLVPLTSACPEAENDGRPGNCTQALIPTMGISDLLHMVEAPAVIDFLSFSARGRSGPVLDAFPWDEFCIRYWTIELAPEEAALESSGRAASQLASRGCLAKVEDGDLWAACPCQVRADAGSGEPTAPGTEPNEDRPVHSARTQHRERLALGLMPDA